MHDVWGLTRSNTATHLPDRITSEEEVDHKEVVAPPNSTLVVASRGLQPTSFATTSIRRYGRWDNFDITGRVGNQAEVYTYPAFLNSTTTRSRPRSFLECGVCCRALSKLEVSIRFEKLRKMSIDALKASVCPAYTKSTVADDSRITWIGNYGSVINMLREWLSIGDFTTGLLSWMYLLVYELGFSTTMVMHHPGGHQLFSMRESRQHLNAAARILDMLKARIEDG